MTSIVWRHESSQNSLRLAGARAVLLTVCEDWPGQARESFGWFCSVVHSRESWEREMKNSKSMVAYIRTNGTPFTNWKGWRRSILSREWHRKQTTLCSVGKISIVGGYKQVNLVRFSCTDDNRLTIDDNRTAIENMENMVLLTFEVVTNGLGTKKLPR